MILTQAALSARETIMFYQTEPFAFTKTLAPNWRVIRDEFLANFDEKNARPWPQKFVYDKDWRLVPLIDRGRMAQHGVVGVEKDLERNRQQFPRTVAILEQLPGLVTAGFSRLTGGSRIHPHKGIDHSVLRCHVGLITPPDCALHVNGQVRSWTEGCVWLFDDTNAHEVWNKGDQVRVVLIMDFNKAELQQAVGRPVETLVQPLTPEEVTRAADLEKRLEEWQKKYAAEEPQPDWEKIFDYKIEDT